MLLGSSSAQNAPNASNAANATSAPPAQTVLAQPTTVTAPAGVPDTTATDQAQDWQPTTTTETVATPTGPTTTTTVKRPATVTGPGVGNAAAQQLGSKRTEALASCAASPPPTSGLLAVGSMARSRGHRSLLWLILVVTVAAAAIAAVAYIKRRQLGTPGGAGRRSTLEVAASLVAITGTLAGIAATYVRGAGVKDHPPPTARMVVRDVQARVTYGAYRAALFDKKPPPAPSKAELASASSTELNRLEIGNVAWLELDLTGYRNTTMVLQWGLFHAGAGAALIPDTTKKVQVRIDDSADVHTQFLPVWLGTPRLRRFQAEFWLLDHGQVRQLASTRAMRGITYRYACRPS